MIYFIPALAVIPLGLLAWGVGIVIASQGPRKRR